MSEALHKENNNIRSLGLVNLLPLMNISTGNPRIAIGIIDGPVDILHPAFRNSKIRSAKQDLPIDCKSLDNLCIHGTFTTGVLAAKRGSQAPAICPNCNVILRPIFGNSKPESTTKELAKAIIETIDAGARIVNLSVIYCTLHKDEYLEQSYAYALEHDVIMVMATGQKHCGINYFVNKPGIIPVTSCDSNGKLDPASYYGTTLAKRGLMAPGVDITSTAPGGRYSSQTGTSVSVPFVTGSVALLWSLFPNVTAAEIIYSIIVTATGRMHNIVSPGLINAGAARKYLNATKVFSR